MHRLMHPVSRAISAVTRTWLFGQCFFLGVFCLAPCCVRGNFFPLPAVRSLSGYAVQMDADSGKFGLSVSGGVRFSAEASPFWSMACAKRTFLLISSR